MKWVEVVVLWWMVGLCLCRVLNDGVVGCIAWYRWWSELKSSWWCLLVVSWLVLWVVLSVERIMVMFVVGGVWCVIN